MKIGAAMLADHPVLGVGLGCSMLGWPLYAPPWYPADGWLGVHNSVVQVFTETGLIGGAVAWALFNGYGASTMAAGSVGQLSFELRVTPELLWTGLKWALAIGFIGGLFPAMRAARLPVTTALREL